jgi:daunorubicin resistance ABC transporter ATP-binding subunit
MAYTTILPTARTADDADIPAVELRGLEVTYGSHRVLDGVNLAVRAGQVFALLGPNGAGKTTAIKVMTTLVRPTAGTASVAGHDVVTAARQVRESISLTGQYAAVDERLTGRENLVMMARLLHLSRRVARARADEMLEQVDLMGAADRLAGRYSGGMRRRLDIAASLLAEPKVLFLDEPTTGLDLRSRHQVWERVRDIAAGGATIFLTTQYLEEADRLADRVAVLDRGRIVAEGAAADLKRRLGEAFVELVLVDGSSVRIPTDGSVRHVRETLAEVDGRGLDVARWRLREPTLDDVFLDLTGHDTTTEKEQR